MVDVSMCLLVFFLLATRMVERENSDIDLPLARSAKDADKQELGNRIVVNIRSETLEGGRTPSYLVQNEEISLSRLLARLETARRLDPKVNCVIRADRDLPYAHVQRVMIGCAAAGIHKVTFSAVPRDEAPDPS